MKNSIMGLGLLVPVAVFAQVIDFGTMIGFIPANVDARSSAMGRTSILSANGSNAIFSNPALISTLEKRQIQAGGRFMMGSMEEEWREEYYDSYDFGLTPDITFNHFSYSMPYELENYDLTVGIGCRTYFDWGGNSESSAKEKDGDKLETNSKSSGGLNVITAAAALRIQDKYHIGVSYNKSVFGSILYEYERTHTDYSDYEEENDIEHSGSFLQYSGFGNINEKIDVGLMYRPEFEWEWEKIKTTVNGNTNTEKNFDITIPSIFGIGFTYIVNPSFTFVGEYQTRNFSDMKFENAESTVDDGVCYRVGAEYYGPALLRFGFYKDAALITDSDDDEPRSAIGFTGGLAYDLGTLHLDAFVDYGTLSAKYEKGDDRLEDTLKMLKIGISFRYYLQS